MMTDPNDEAIAKNFMRYLLGNRELGSADNEIVSTPHSPELMALLEGRLGPLPRSWWNAGQIGAATPEGQARHALAVFLRDMADAIDPGAA